MAPRFSRPRLIDANDRQYRAHLAEIMMTKSNYRPTRPPLARELFGGEAEIALRQMLAARAPLSERRYIEYLEHKGRSAIKKYRELDAVAIDGSDVHIYEVKASEKATSIRRAAQQLRDSSELLRMLFRTVTATILLVDTGIPKTEADIAAIMAAADAPYAPPPTLDEVLATMPSITVLTSIDEQPANQVGLLLVSVETIISIAGAENLHLNWDEDALLPADEEVTEQAAEDSAAGEAPDAGGAFAEALRKAMNQGDNMPRSKPTRTKD